MKQNRYNLQMTDRYQFDLKECTYANGWAQLDSRQDAPYYGNWVNPFTRELVSYCEGDVTRTTCDSDEEFIAEVRKNIEWHNEAGYGPALIDALASPEIRDRLTTLGLASLLH